MKRRDFIKGTAAFASIAFLPSSVWASVKNGKLRTAHIGVGGMGASDLKSISSHPLVEVTALCDVDSNNLAAALKLHPGAKVYTDYRKLFDEIGKSIDAVIVSTPDHTHAPASMMAMNMGKPVYCQKPLTHHVSEARAMRKLAEENRLITQMGIQCHSSDAYRKAVLSIQSGIIGKVSCVRSWSPKNWGYDGPAPVGSDPVPDTLNWNLWLGTSPERPYKDEIYHPENWRKLLDYGCGTLGDMGVHIFDTPYTALDLDVPETIKTECRKPTGFGHPEHNVVKYKFPEIEKVDHYHQFVDACLGKGQCSAPFSYAARLTESILLGVVANRFPKKRLHRDIEKARFSKTKANKLLESDYRNF